MKKFIKINVMILVMFSLFTIKSLSTEIQNQDKLDELEEQKNSLEAKTEEYSSELEFINEELSGAIVEISELTQNILDKQSEIEELTAKSEEIYAKIEKTEKNLKQVTESYKKQKDLLEKRLVAIYEMGDTSYLDLLLSSKGISNFLSNYYYMSEITLADSELLNVVEGKKEDVETLMQTLQDDKQDLEQAKADLEKASIAISNLIIIKNQRIRELSEEELNLQKEIEEYQSQIQEIESEIKLLSLASDNSEYVGGTLIWPVPGYTRISSQFGMRTHPITGVYKLHTGTDISAPYGSTFVASGDGMVVKAGYNTAYGNMVIVDHGAGITTLYAHGSEILVEVRSNC